MPLHTLTSNLISGLLLMLERPFSIGDISIIIQAL